jgi:hypothetical protein
MSATRDKSVRVGFVYSNLYELYKKGVTAAKAAPSVQHGEAESSGYTPLGLTRGKVLKAETVAELDLKVRAFEPAEFLGRRIEGRKAIVAISPKSVIRKESEAVSGLKDSLAKLHDLHERLRFMLKEIEDLSKNKS